MNKNQGNKKFCPTDIYQESQSGTQLRGLEHIWYFKTKWTNVLEFCGEVRWE